MILDPVNGPDNVSKITGVPKDDLIGAARLFATQKNAAIYYGLGVTEHSQGSTMVMGMANLAMATGNIGRSGVGVNPMRGQNNVQGSCDMGSFPHEFSGYRPVGDDAARGLFEKKWGVKLDGKPGYRIPNMFDEACAGNYKGMYIQGEDVAQSDPNIQHVEAALKALDILIVQDLFLNETARFAHVFLPGTSFLEKDGTFINAERRINRVRPVMKSQTGKDEWEVTQDLGRAMGIDMGFNSASEIMDEIAELTPTFTNVSFDVLDAAGSLLIVNSRLFSQRAGYYRNIMWVRRRAAQKTLTGMRKTFWKSIPATRKPKASLTGNGCRLNPAKARLPYGLKYRSVWHRGLCTQLSTILIRGRWLRQIINPIGR